MINLVSYSKEWSRLTEEQQTIIKKFQNNNSVRVGDIANELGLTVILATLPLLVSGEIRPDPNNQGKFIIKINMHEPKVKQRFTVAHEIAHFLLHSNLINDTVEESVLYRSRLSNSIEAEANRLAADIIIPPSIVNELLDDVDVYNEIEIANLANTLKVSVDALKIRLRIRD